jgi:hypothetical protein
MKFIVTYCFDAPELVPAATLSPRSPFRIAEALAPHLLRVLRANCPTAQISVVSAMLTEDAGERKEAA